MHPLHHGSLLFALRLVLALALALAFLLATAGVARAAAQTPIGACALDSAPKDTVRQVVYFTQLHAPKPGKELADPAELRPLFYGQALAPHFRAPTRVALGGGSLGLLPRQTAVDGVLAFLITPAGRVDAAAMVVPTRSAQLDTALVDAVGRADSAGAFRELAAERTTLDTVILRVTAADTPPARSVPLFRLQLNNVLITHPALLLEEPPVVAPRDAPGRSAGSDHLVLQFIVGLDGRVEPESVRFSSARDREFALAARDALLGARYQPARVGSCPVRQVVEMSVGFGTRWVPRQGPPH